MKLSIHQPHYLPWLNYFGKIQLANNHVWLDNVENQDKGFQNRTHIKNHNGLTLLTVPIIKSRKMLINDILIDGNSWKQKHCKTIQQSYSNWKLFIYKVSSTL